MALYFGVGRREMGKTTLLYKMSSRLPRRIIFDPRSMVRANLDAIVVADVEDMRQAVRALSSGAFEAHNEFSEIVYSPADDLDDAFDAFAEELRRWITHTPERQVAVLIDEASFIDQKTKNFQWVAKCSPVDTFHLMMSCHRPLDIHTSLRSIANHWLIFQCRQEHDLQVIRERCSPEVAEEVQRLAPRHFAHWDDGRAVLSVNRHGGTGTKHDWFVPLRAKLEPREIKPAGIVESGEPVGRMGRLPLVAQDSEERQQ